MASLANVEHRNQDATVYVGNLDPACNEDLLTELFVQVGPVKSVFMPKDKLTNQHNGYGFVEYLDVIDADYAMTVLNMIKLFNRPMRVSKSALNEDASRDVGANLFVGNLDPNEVNEQLLYDTFSAFGTLIKPPVLARDEESQASKGYAFVHYDNFQAADTAIACMHEQFLGSRQITVQFAFKKDADGKQSTERHGSRAERMLAEAKHKTQSVHHTFRPNTLFASTTGGTAPVPPPPPPPPPPVTGISTMPPPPPPPPVRGAMPPPPPPPPLPPANMTAPPPPPPPMQ